MTRRPATIVEDLTIPFPRPRDMAIGESREFNEICGHLRGRIEESHYRDRRPTRPRRRGSPMTAEIHAAPRCRRLASRGHPRQIYAQLRPLILPIATAGSVLLFWQAYRSVCASAGHPAAAERHRGGAVAHPAAADAPCDPDDA